MIEKTFGFKKELRTRSTFLWLLLSCTVALNISNLQID
eukprot:COSAG02_NODE_48154_length_336_cov_0.455696_2_plen_37_part_01